MYKTKRPILAFIIFFILSQTCLSNEYKIIPKNKAKIFKKIGESVYVACKNNGTLNTKCLIDCGNGKRFESINGLCTYLKTGIFQLNISVLKENINHYHSATVTVTNNIPNPQNRKNKKAIATRKDIKSTPHSNDIIKHDHTQTKTISVSQELFHEQNLAEITMDNENVNITLANELPGADHLPRLNSLKQNIETINTNTTPSINPALGGLPSGNDQSYGFQWQHMK